MTHTPCSNNNKSRADLSLMSDQQMPRKRTLYPCVHMPAMSRHDRLRLIKLTGSFGIPSRDSCSDRLALAGPARSPASLFFFLCVRPQRVANASEAYSAATCRNGHFCDDVQPRGHGKEATFVAVSMANKSRAQAPSSSVTTGSAAAYRLFSRPRRNSPRASGTRSKLEGSSWPR